MDHDKTKNVVAWFRVSSLDQKNGFSLSAQRRLIEEFCLRMDAVIIRGFETAESARPNIIRREFDSMLSWVRENAKKSGIEGIVFHKVDRAIRNLRDVVRLEELKRECGVKLYFVDQH